MVWTALPALASLLCSPSFLLGCQAPAQEPAPAFELTQEVLHELELEVEPVVQATLGAQFQGGVSVRLAAPVEIEASLFEENVGLMRQQVADPEVAEGMAREFARGLSPALLAKYRLGKREILVCSGAFADLAELLGLPELLSRGAVRAVLVHELAHAASDELYGASETLYRLDGPDRIQAYNAVLEGYAQHVARRICAARGWMEGFLVYERAIASPPRPGAGEGEDAALDYLTRLQIEVFAARYRDGERFIAALERAGGNEAVARAFREPPTDSALILEPAWFLDPSSRPALVYDLERPLDEFEAEHPAPDWGGTRLTLNASMARAALSLLPEEDVERALRSLRNGRVLTLTPPRAPDSQMIVLALYEFASPDDARQFLWLQRRLLEAKDEALKEGTVRIVASSYEELEEEGLDGFLSAKRVRAGPQEIPVLSGCGVRGRLCAEVLFSNMDAAPGDAAVALQRALATASGTSAAPEREDASGGEGD